MRVKPSVPPMPTPPTLDDVSAGQVWITTVPLTLVGGGDIPLWLDLPGAGICDVPAGTLLLVVRERVLLSVPEISSTHVHVAICMGRRMIVEERDLRSGWIARY